MATATQNKPSAKALAIVTGDIFSEISHYTFKEPVVKEVKGKKVTFYKFLHLESGKEVELGGDYVDNLLTSADLFDQEVPVGREDKHWTDAQIKTAIKDGTLPKDTQVRAGDVRVKGIRSIWADVHSSQVFTVNFDKQPKELSQTAYNKAKEAQLQGAVELLAKAQSAKKGVKELAAQLIKEIQDNPITLTERGEERTLRGFKTQFTSITGNYSVVDMDITDTNNTRLVNVNTINWLIINGSKFNVV